MRQTRPAYTVFELIVVLAVLVVVTALAVPYLDSMCDDTKLTAAADMVKARLADARGQAKKEGRPYRFAVLPNTGTCRVEPAGAEAVGLPAEGGNGFCIEDNLPGEARFAVTGTPGDEPGANFTTAVVFMPDGTARGDAEIAIGAANGRPVVIRVRAATGAVTTAHGPEAPQP